MEQELRQLEAEAEEKLSTLENLKDLDEVRVRYLGRKGLFTSLLRQLGQVSAEDRPRLGKLANEIKEELEQKFNTKKSELTVSEAGAVLGRDDLSLPGRLIPSGRLHPVTQIMDEVCSIFVDLGFAVAEGPDVELDYYNFEALNIPQHHPARDMHDTFYISDSILLRTHTSPMQIRATDLKGVLTIFCQKMFDQEDIRLRFRPSFFPFTEPSAEVDIGCVICRGDGCRVCKQTGWLEILGAGMIDPEVFKMVDYDPEEFSGFAFGLGIERIAMLKYGIDDIRLFYDNDLRFLNQF
jgi:phenylalanyl-tRNA synthetase alpha chain